MTFTTRQIKGHGRGKLLGFPTINMEIPTGMDLLEGIYAAWISIGGKTFMGALHYGPVPVFGQQTNSLEVFLLDVRDDQIGDTSSIEVDPVKRLREIRSFAGSVELAAQIKQDVAKTRAALSAV